MSLLHNIQSDTINKKVLLVVSTALCFLMHVCGGCPYIYTPNYDGAFLLQVYVRQRANRNTYMNRSVLRGKNNVEKTNKLEPDTFAFQVWVMRSCRFLCSKKATC